MMVNSSRHIYNTDRLVYFICMEHSPSTSPAPLARGAPRSQKSHSAILAAAQTLAETGGPQALSIEAVARHAHVGKQTIYRWWPTRIDLLIEVYDVYVPVLQGLDVQRPLRDVLKSLFETYREGPAGQLLVALIALSRSDETAQQKFLTRFVIPRRDALATYLVKCGESRRSEAKQSADLVVAMIWQALLSEPSRLNDTFCDHICSLVQASQLPSSSRKTSFTIKSGYRRGLAGALISLHMDYYGSVWRFGRNFETLITRDFGLILNKYNPDLDQLIWVEDEHGDIVGTLVIEASSHAQNEARLRFFILATQAQGQSLGHKMLNQALSTCRERGQNKLFLTTFKGLDSARRLYERAGFTLTQEFTEDDWGEDSQEVRYDLDLNS